MLELNFARQRAVLSAGTESPRPLDAARLKLLGAPGIPLADREALLRLLDRWRFPPDAACPGEALIAEYGHWQLYLDALAGDADAGAGFNRYWRRYAGAVMGGRFAPDDRDEIVAAFLSRILRLVRPPFAWSCPFTTYLRAILLNVIRDHAGGLGRRARTEASLEGEAGSTVARLPAPGPTPEAELLAAERRRGLLQAMESLPGKDRAILRACVLEEQSGQDVAIRLGIRPGALYQRLCRAKRRLRQALAAAGTSSSTRSKEPHRHDRLA